MDRKVINARVSKILGSGSQATLPIDIEAIAIARGLKVVAYKLGPDVSGLLSIENGKGTIAYNEIDSPVRQRFTIAHELGHYELHKEKSHLFVDQQFIYRSQNSKNTEVNKIMEQEANLFASMILMPTSIVWKEFEKMQFDLGSEGTIDELAKKFKVSVAAMTIRINDLGLL